MDIVDTTKVVDRVNSVNIQMFNMPFYLTFKKNTLYTPSHKHKNPQSGVLKIPIQVKSAPLRGTYTPAMPRTGSYS